ncbi:bifunctional metallophosphatase/5'-nucleotidase [Gloeothece verrucosa]|uniref:5'-Nucleotidase domain protein n=1 Tax=Gloeothece verrucosa (strain PCC 7822) TaxID=497965 RepID=E0UDH1_GLOV7|nr:bifunctional metallophosphatase/5'-nucleotidase [Gloeothece verrucosa]ADN14162.1 5'-Nucleotidase domain protein [Gloeothece verrucosa PCC 7822]
MKQWQKLAGSVLFFGFVIFSPIARAEEVKITLLQLNDVYEISSLAEGKQGGLARVATLEKDLKKTNPNTYTILAGDCLSPSALGTAIVNGQSLAGEQMVAVLNAMGLDFATFGNHEFDLKYQQFLKRLEESKFTWISSNVFDKENKPFPKVEPYKIITIPGKANTTVKVGLIGLTLDSNPADYVTYKAVIETARQQVQQLKGQVDIIIAVTHLALAQDQELAQTIPEIDLILGGHEHENIQQWRGNDYTPVFKADANAKSVYIHYLTYDTQTKHLTIESQLKPVTDAIPDDLNTAKIVKQWQDKGYQAFRAQGFAPEEVIATTTESLDGLEASVRNKSTRLTELIAQAMLNAVPEPDLAIYNSGSIRIDDILYPGKITQYDVLRILPFGGEIMLVEMKGSLLEEILEQGIKNQGTGGYLQTANVQLGPDGKTFFINDQALDPEKTYRVAINDFLMKGKETGMSFLTEQAPGLKVIGKEKDIRQALMDQLKLTYNSKAINR